MSNPRKIGRLLYRKSRNELNESEEKALAVWRKESPENEQLYLDKMDPEKVRSSMIRYYEKRDLIFEKIKKRVPELADAKLSNQDFSDFKEEGKYSRMFPLRQVAYFGGLFVLGFFIFMILRITGVISKTPITHKDAVGDSPEGVEIVIDDASTSFGATRAGIEMKENEIGEKDYYAENRDRDKRWRYSVPTGDQRRFRLIFTDGTWVWVHSNTRIKYPINFSQDTIRVTVLGEAYFEVNKDSLHPYIINQPSTANSQPPTRISITAYSAHFDVNAYPDSSAMLITVITGNLSMRMDSVAGKPQSEIQLSTGQQAEVKDGKMTVIQNVDVNKILERARWYNAK